MKEREENREDLRDTKKGRIKCILKKLDKDLRKMKEGKRKSCWKTSKTP